MSSGARFEPVRPVRLYQRIVEQVEDAITSGQLPPGSRLPSERELVVQFGASRPTVREALRVLESNGLVQSRPGDPRGPEVLPYSATGLRKQFNRLLQAGGMAPVDVISFRMILDGHAAMLAAQLRTEEELQQLEASIDTMSAAADEGFEAFSRADIAFHDLVFAASRNPILGACNDVVRGIVVSLISSHVANAGNRAHLMHDFVVHHREVLDAVRAGDGQAASRIACRNLYDEYRAYVPASDLPRLLATLHPEDQVTRRTTKRQGRSRTR